MVLLVSPLSLLDGSELLGLGDALPGAVPGGVLLIGAMLLDEPDGVDVPTGAVLDDEGLIDEDDGEVLPEVVPLEVDGIVVLGVVELVSVVGVAGGSVLLQAPSAATVAAMATHLIELRIFTPTVWGQCRRVRARPVPQRRSDAERRVGVV